MHLTLYFFFFFPQNCSTLQRRKKLIFRQPLQAIKPNRESFQNQQIMERLNMNHSEKTFMLKFQSQQKCLKRVKCFYSFTAYCGNRRIHFFVREECELIHEQREFAWLTWRSERGNQKLRSHCRKWENHLQRFRAVRNLCVFGSIKNEQNQFGLCR